MEHAVKRFARRILLIHLLLLLVVLGLVFFASRAIENGARENAMRQAQRRQEMLANQTARGIEGFYQNVLDVMNLLPRADDNPAERSLVDLLITRTPNVKTPLGPRGVGVGFLLSRQLETRVAHLFIVDKKELVPYSFMKDDLQPLPKTELRPVPPPNPRGGKPSTRPTVARPPGAAPAAAGPSSGPAMTEAMRTEWEIVERNKDFIRAVDAQSVSPFEVYDSGGGMNLVCLAIGPRKDRVLVAAVPVQKIDEQFLDALNSDAATGAWLVDESTTAMAASREEMVGMNLARDGGPNVQAFLRAFGDVGFKGTRIETEPFLIAGERYEPALVTAAPIEILPGKRWSLIVASPLSDVDNMVSETFRRITLWAIFVIAAVTAILVSTAVTMIRSRLRLERMRHADLKRELDRARQIQQAWLPRDGIATDALEVTAVNFPANHISGDFYNWFDLRDGRIAIVIGDVTGHGMSAAFLMATTQLLVRNTMRDTADPGRCLGQVNRELCALGFNGQFVTMVVLVMDPATGKISLSTAGHPAPLIGDASAAGGFRQAAMEPQYVLGVVPDARYETQTVQLEPGSTVLLYTDGAADVEAPDGRRFGDDGLRNALPLRRGTAQGLLDAVLRAVNHFRRNRALSDDLTMVALRWTGATAAEHPGPPATPAARPTPVRRPVAT